MPAASGHDDGLAHSRMRVQHSKIYCANVYSDDAFNSRKLANERTLEGGVSGLQCVQAAISVPWDQKLQAMVYPSLTQGLRQRLFTTLNRSSCLSDRPSLFRTHLISQQKKGLIETICKLRRTPNLTSRKTRSPVRWRLQPLSLAAAQAPESR